MLSRVTFVVFFMVTVASAAYYYVWRPPNEDLRIVTPAGTVVGTFGKTVVRGRKISQFVSIPYAKPPVGPLRFMKTQALDDPPESQVINSLSRPPKCLQEVMFAVVDNLIEGQEDCLYLNVYAPPGSGTAKKLPVMVFVHGGGFNVGEGYTYGPGYLLERDVILVNFNYRLGPLGFLNLNQGGDSTLPSGNLGLWDQRAALQWVKRNIGSFGGDPDKITLFGESAGGWSVNYHLLADKTKGLFQSAIIQSGPILSSFLAPGYSDKTDRDLHKAYAERLGCSSIECLRAKTAEEIMESRFDKNRVDECAFGKPYTKPSSFAPTDDSNQGKDAFFSTNPIQAQVNGDLANKVPLMIGFNKDEGLLETLPTGLPLDQGPLKKAFAPSSWEKCAPSFMIDAKKGKSHAVEMANQAKVFYFGEGQEFDPDKNLGNLTDFITDGSFAYGTHHTISAWSKVLDPKKSPIFYYTFEHQGSFSFADMFAAGKLYGMLKMFAQMALGIFESGRYGVCHGDELLYLFDILPDWLVPRSEIDLKLRSMMVDIWANFATTHKPIPTLEDLKKEGVNVKGFLSGKAALEQMWYPVNPKTLSNGVGYVRIFNQTVTTKPDLSFNRRMKAWDKWFNPM